MKVFEIISDVETLKTDIKHNKGKAISAIIRGAKRKANGIPCKDNDLRPETNTVMG